MRVFFVTDFTPERRQQYVTALRGRIDIWLREASIVDGVMIQAEQVSRGTEQAWAIYPCNIMSGPISDAGWARAHREWDLRATADLIGGLVLSPATMLLRPRVVDRSSPEVRWGEGGSLADLPPWGRVTRAGDPVEVVIGEPIRYRRADYEQIVAAPDLHLVELDRMARAERAVRGLTVETLFEALSAISEPPRKKPKDPNWKPNIWEA